jgi:hypothetical protein
MAECRCCSSGLWRHVDLYVDTSISEEHTVSIFSTSALKMKIVCFSKMLVSTYKSTWHNNPVQYWYLHYHENLTFHQMTKYTIQQTVNKEEIILKIVDSNTTTSICRISCQTHVPQMMVLRILNCYNYYPVHQQVYSSPKITLNVWNSATGSFKKYQLNLHLLFTKVMLTRDGILKHRNSHSWALENPNNTNETHFQHRFSGVGLLTTDLLDHVCLNTT